MEDGRGVGVRGIHLSPRIHQEYTFRHRSACRTPAESRQECLPSRKEYVDAHKTWWDEGTRGKNRSVSRTGPALGGLGELKQGSNPHIPATVSVRGETFKVERETADLWQPKGNETQRVLATAIHTPDRNTGPLEGTAAGSWSLGIVEQLQDEGCC